MANLGEMTFRESVDLMFSKAAQLSNLEPGLEERIKTWIPEEQKIFLHIRRGDPKLPWAYVNLEAAHPVQTWDYYERALSKFPEDVPVVVFSIHESGAFSQVVAGKGKFTIIQ